MASHSLPTFTLTLLFSLFLTLCGAAALIKPASSSIDQPANITSILRAAKCHTRARPKVSLPGDRQKKSYISSSGIDCLDDSSSHISECWGILDLDEWLPQWFLHIPQCAPQASSNSDCNQRDPAEPWTTTFMRITMGGGDWNGCSDIGNMNCQYIPYPCLGSNDHPLLRARYKYVAYTITSM